MHDEASHVSQAPHSASSESQASPAQAAQLQQPAATQSVQRPHAIVASLLAKSTSQIVTALGQLPLTMTHAEIRLDGLWTTIPDEEQATDDLMAIVDAANVPLIATLRPTREGGLYQGPEEVRVGLLLAAARAGFSCVDLELDAAQVPGLRATLEAAGAKVFASRHHEGPLPCRDDGLLALNALQDAGGQGGPDKFALPTGSFADALRALELTYAHAQRHGHPTVSNLGYGGAPLRALLALAGNHATYGHAPTLPPAVSGQPGIADIEGVWEHWGVTPSDLNPRTEGPAPWYAVLGMPVLHSLSPRLHNAALRADGLPNRFGTLEVPASISALRLVAHVAPRIGLAGVSVTSPHKPDAARISSCDDVAKQVGAANCLRFPAGALQPEATNTDATALLRLLSKHVDPGVPAVIVGAGGAARAAAWALRECGAAVRFTSRDLPRAQQLAKDLGAKWTSWERRSNLRAPIWVQATPSTETIATVPQLRGAQLAIELAYRAMPTSFERDARIAGAEVVGGRAMLVEQAIDAYRFWHGREAPRPIMEAALAGPR